MANRRNMGIEDTPLKLANEITAIVNRAWEDGSFLENVTPVTRDLLQYWFSDVFCDMRPFNFHPGQKQAILNMIYIHEVWQQAKYQYPKYCMKMATGTGKTWVIAALLIWQYLNAEEDKPTERYSKHFLLAVPGLIMYERLLDSYLGKEMEDNIRNFATSDFKKFEALFVPPAYKAVLFNFLQTSVVSKEEIGRKVTGDEMVAITNGNYLSRRELDFLAKLSELVVFSMEAEWQTSLNKTHIVVSFDLKSAIRQGVVKTIVLNCPRELAVEDQDYKAVHDGRKAIALSEGQKLLLRAGLQKLRILEREFGKFTKGHKGLEGKYPKMLVICEDTTVSPLVTEFLTAHERLSEEDVIQIDSGWKGKVSEKEWKEIKQRLFNVDHCEKPKVIVSALMLREGFDVNNICVIVPLRSSEAPILLEQIAGRGLRLMWREPEFLESKAENRIRVLEKQQEPNNYLDILSIVEHPAFLQSYEDAMQEGLVGETEAVPNHRESIVGDMIHTGLKDNYQDYDLFWPVIAREQEEKLQVIVTKQFFSEVSELRMRKNFALNLVKTIYKKLPYPSNKGEFEKFFMLFCDRDSKVDAFVKINEYYHSFASITYVRTDGMLASYCPDFMVKMGGELFVVETKAQKELEEANVKQKQYSALEWIARVNQLRSENRMDCEWSYVLLGEAAFYEMLANGALAKDVFDWAKLDKAKIGHRQR
ncbi:DEAD/DEAH box helicase family protein [Aneurinibacillus tyrosinisolvens]|uniref:DEAD/DEAH box helicase family protein n=1 Tax=Aneurinibacillus tyrosinisolvens TaxID=1443435 RepID=UPI00063F70F6|nr:DEAD/DEAH box helicase family protein [Aneurinibacillus tyrosinisolvens]